MKVYLACICLFPLILNAQIGGQRAFDFLRLIPSARINALGGENISTLDHDPLMSSRNPALSNDKAHSMLAFAWANYISDIRYGQFWYNHSLKKNAVLHGGVQFLNYGDFTRTDVLGNHTGNFTAGAHRFSLGASREFDKLRFGATFHYLAAYIDGYRTSALAVDMGGAWTDTTRLLTVGFVLRNLGSTLQNTRPAGQNPALPFDMQCGVSKRLEHLPLRFSLTGVMLNRFMGLLYQDENAPPEFDLSGQEIPVKKRTFDKFARHLVLGAELSLSQHVYLRAGYNHMRRQELKTINHGGTSGFGFGAGIKISWCTFDYGYGRFHASSNLHQFTLAMALAGPFKSLR